MILGVSTAVRGELSNREKALDTFLDGKGILAGRTVLGTEIFVDQKPWTDRVFAWLAWTPCQAQNVNHTCNRKGGLFFIHSDHACPKLLGGVLLILFTEPQIEGRQGVFSKNFDAPVESLFRLAPGALFKNDQAL